MPLIYGSNFPLPALSADEVGNLVTQSSSNLGWLSILLNIIEVGGSLILGPEFGTALALGNAAAQTGINYEETGSIDATTVGLNFGAALIPGLASGVKNVKLGFNAANALAKSGEDLTSGLIGNLYNNFGEFTDVGKGALSKAQDIKDTLGAITKNPFTNSAKQLQKSVNSLTSKLSGDLNVLNPSKILSNAGIGNVFSDIKSQVLNVGRISGLGESAIDVTTDTENKIFRTITEETNLYNSEIRALRAIIKDGKITNLKLYRSILEKAVARSGNLLLKAAIEGTKSVKVLKLLSRTETTAMKLSRLSSKSIAWTQKVGGYITSPSSLAADTISKTVAKLTSKVEEIGEEIASKMQKWVKLGSKGIENAQEEFVRTGGILFKSKWIMGYKVLQEDLVGSSIIIQFKNSHPNVITKLTESKILAWAEAKSRGNWYINNIARSRGGRHVSELGIEGKLENLLGMLPISKINEIIGFAGFTESFISQIRVNSTSAVWHTGNYIKGFKQGLIQGIISEGIKASVALGTQNQYAKQVLEGGFGAVSSGTSFGTAFSSSFAGGAQSMKDTIFEDTTKSGSVVKNLKVIQGTGSSVKGIL